MFGRGKKGPSQPTGPFAHAEGCKILVADPCYEPEWQEIETAIGGELASAIPKTAAPARAAGRLRSMAPRKRGETAIACRLRRDKDLLKQPPARQSGPPRRRSPTVAARC
jgi:hypothetical protein